MCDINFTWFKNIAASCIRTVRGGAIILFCWIMKRFYYVKFRGVGYRVWISNDADGNRWLALSLGWSHYQLIRIPVQLQIWCRKGRALFFGQAALAGNFVDSITKLSRLNPYSGKGIQLSNFTLKLKKGKVR